MGRKQRFFNDITNLKSGTKIFLQILYTDDMSPVISEFKHQCGKDGLWDIIAEGIA